MGLLRRSARTFVHVNARRCSQECVRHVVLLFAVQAFATIFGTVQGVVHDPSHRPVGDVEVSLRAVNSDYVQHVRTGDKGGFEFRAVPAGEYKVHVSLAGFAEAEQTLVVASGAAPVLHFQLRLAAQRQSIEVSASPEAVNPQSSTPTTLITRQDIQRTPGADLSNSLAMITDFVPGAYMTHDQLHVRGGHQVTWAIDGIPIPNTNIASNVGPQIDPKDIDYLEVQRGGYSSEYGDRTYGMFNVVPRTGFERNREMEVNTTYGSFHQTNDQVNLGDHTQRFAYFGSVNANRSDYGLGTPGPEVLHDRVWGTGAFASLIFNKDAANQFRFVASAARRRIPDSRTIGRPWMPEFATWNGSAMRWPISPGFTRFRRACCLPPHRSSISIARTTMAILTTRR